jgi:hypothetical protein
MIFLWCMKTASNNFLSHVSRRSNSYFYNKREMTLFAHGGFCVRDAVENTKISHEQNVIISSCEHNFLPLRL